MTRDTVKIATWAGGYELHRLLAYTYDMPVGTETFRITNSYGRMGTTFIVKKNDVDPVYLYSFRVWRKTNGNHHVLNVKAIDEQVAFVEQEPRRVLMSAIVDVLDVRISNGSSSSSTGMLSDGITPYVLKAGELHQAQSEDHCLSILGEKLTQESIDLLRDGKLTNSEKDRLFKIRTDYQNEAFRTIQLMNKTVHCLPDIRRIAYFPSMWEETIQMDFGELKSQTLGTKWYLILQLGFLPQPSWKIYLREEPYRTLSDGRKDGMVLVENNPSLLGALIQAGILLEDSEHALSDWVQAHKMPEPETVIVDTEAYHLLGAELPFFLPNKEFLLWAQTVLHWT